MAAVAVAAATAIATRSASAQEWRTLESSRQLRGADAASVRVEYAAGTIDIVPTTDAMLYRMRLRYDAERSAPIASFDEASRSVSIGTRSATSSGWNKSTREGSTLRLDLTRNAPLRLALELGAARGDLQLGGLRLADLTLKTGATELRVDFAEPNRESLANFDLDVGAAGVTVTRAGNARASRVHINVGAGTLDYDLSGDWQGDADLSANIAVGQLTLRVPMDAGVRITAKTFMAGFDRAGLEKRGDAWYSPGYDSAKRRVTANVTAVLGSFDLVRR
jgi:hypothetical protein